MITTIHKSKQPRRPHFIREWAEKRQMTQADLSRKLGADKSIVSRWYDGATPSEDYQQRLAGIFHCSTDAIFRHPDDDWVTKFFEGRRTDEIERIKRTLEAAFPRKTG